MNSVTVLCSGRFGTIIHGGQICLHFLLPDLLLLSTERNGNYLVFTPRALGWMVEKICNKLIFSGIVQQAIMNDISKIPWNPNCGNYKIIPNIPFLVPLLLGQMPACLMTWCALQGQSTLPQHSLFHTPHMVWLAACQALRGGADAVVWNSLSVNLEWLQLTTLSYHNEYLVDS